VLTIAASLTACRRDTPPYAIPPDHDAMEAIVRRAPALRVPLRPMANVATPFATRPIAAGEMIVVGLAGRFYGIDAKKGVLAWTRDAQPALFRAVTDGARAFLPFVDRAGQANAVEVEPKSGRVLRETTLRRAKAAAPGDVDVPYNTAPALAGRLILWPSSRRLTAFDLTSGEERWAYEAEGPTTYRRFQFGSEPPLVDQGVAYWAHLQGIAAVDVATGKARWAWPGYRGFALRPVLGPEHIFATSDKEVVALDRATGAARWVFAPEGLRFEHVASEDMAGFRSGVYWFIGEPLPFHYWLLFLDAKTGKGRAASELFGRGLTGSVTSDGVRLYARLGEWLVCYALATAKPLWRMPLGGSEGGSSPQVAVDRVWIVSSDGVLLGADTRD
jgi:outer membrane protein assembly factor BamB